MTASNGASNITFKSDIPDILAPWERCPARMRVTRGMPREFKDPMRALVRTLQDKPPMIWWRDIAAFIEPATAGADSEMEARRMIGHAIASLIELAKLDENKVNDPFFAAIYRQSIKSNHVEAAIAFIRAAGGWETMRKAMGEYVDAHRDIADAPSAMMTMTGFEIAPEHPETPEQSVTRVCDLARMVVTRTGGLVPLFAALDATRKGIMFRAPSHSTSKSDTNKFFEACHKIGMERIPGACRFVRATEAWIGRAKSDVAPSKSENRREAIVTLMWDDEQGIVGAGQMEFIEHTADGVRFLEVEPIASGSGHAADFTKLKPLTLTAESVAEIEAECMAVLEWLTKFYANQGTVTNAEFNDMMTPKAPIMKDVIDRAEAHCYSTLHVKNEGGEDQGAILSPNTIGSIGKVLCDQGFIDASSRIMSAMEHTSAVAKLHSGATDGSA